MERRILLAEDSRTQAERVRLLLEGAGYRVDVVNDGREGLERIRSAPPDLVISDVVMPRMDGYAFCQAVKSDERTRRIPFVLLTERSTPLDILKGLERGADNFITKPFEDDYLLERVQRIFEHLQFREQGHLEVEVAVRAAGRQITISADKQQIVELLFSTFEDLCRMNDRLQESQRAVEEYTRNLEGMVQERTRELRTLFDGIPIGLVRTTKTGRILDANPALAQLMNFPDRESLLRTNLAAFYVDPEDRARLMNLLESQQVVHGFETRFRRNDGSVVWVGMTTRAIQSGEGETLYEGAIQDIDEQKRAEQELERNRQLIFQSEKLAAMGSLLAGVAHELNNPLSVISGQVALLRDSVKEGPVAARAEKISRATDRCARIIKNFLALARQRPMERQAVSLGEVVREAVELIAYQLRVDDVEVQFDLTQDVPRMSADPHQLHQLVVNLVSNAHHALRQTRPPRRIRLTTRLDSAQERVRLEVADTGPGVPAAIQARIFEPFFTTKPPGEGTGLGLALCRGIVEEHGGAITLENAPEGGALFVIALPLGQRPEAEAAAPAGEAPALRGRHVLVVDDEADVAETLADMLSADGHRVETAANGLRALEKLQDGGYDLILSDLKMPELDGPGLYRALVQRKSELARKVIFLTGDGLSPQIKEFLEQTHVVSLAKPFTPDEVRRAVRLVLAGP
jgi:two-component system NtrC family sensor kinase